MPAIATSITRDPLDPKTLKPSKGMKNHSANGQAHGADHAQ